MREAVLLNDTSNWYHHGCHFASLGLKALIRERYRLKASISIADLLPRQPASKDSRSLQPRAIAQFVEANEDLFETIRAADVVVINGEGSIHGTSPFVWTIFSIIVAAKRLLSKEVHLVNHSVFPHDVAVTRSTRLEDTYKEVYNLIDYVAVREVLSYRLLSALDIGCELSFDSSVLGLPEVAPSREERLVVFGGSPAFTANGVEQLVKALPRFLCQGWTCQFLYGAKSRPAGDDQRLLRELEKHGGDLEVVELREPVELAERIAAAQVLISGRFHYTIAAYVLGTRFVMLEANTPKNWALSEMLRVPRPIAWEAPELADELEHALDSVQHLSHGPETETLRSLARKNIA